jgi:hypothetical protein
VSLPERLGESVAQMDLWPLRRAMLVLWRKARLCESALTSAPILRASRAAACPGLSFIPAGVRMQPSNGLPPPSPPTEKATAREDQAGQSCTKVGNWKSCGGNRQLNQVTSRHSHR